MRLIGTLSNENDARRLASYLKRQGVTSSCEVSFDSASGHMSYQLWVHDEDRITDAIASFQKFLASPSSAEFNAPVIEEKEEAPLPNPEEPAAIDILERKKSARLTTTDEKTIAAHGLRLGSADEETVGEVGGKREVSFLHRLVQVFF